ncbi:PhoU family transcriptional regulator [Thermosipho affectus]|uniref:PhoU family transcriptional regulator n=1 Tax=Thermosipho affectus TaxID=660294 RepID=A0ABX3IHN0_9BACT|nr:MULTISPECIES: PhoU domain-containing protein [Thermosipho]ANQ54395.1 PhoU family transcriptional regulator [Thermosipho sp. 1070]APT72840.1 PhoU family transcriptional regulator [Thermosipho sp. 1063]ONN26828.1 PhoU family transcriptional regulator [Thermosipho affectus]OOC42273.1 PhoU family transcriptional regulator [Thermosipho sp. 1074]
MDWILKEHVEDLKKMVLKEGWLIESLLNQVLNALKERDKDAAFSALKNENDINVMDMKIREKALIILSTMMPMSRELRMVTGSFVISSYFQEIAEKTLDIAKKVLELIKEPQLKPLITIPEMTKISLIMLRESMRMFADQNVSGAESICEKDAEIDNFFEDIRKELMVYMMEDSKYVKRALILLEISQRIEEIADLATKIVETTSYIITGRQYKCYEDKLHTIESLEDKA